MQQISLGKTLDVEVVEQELAALWQGSTDAPGADDETAILRARAANLLVFVSDEKSLEEVHKLLPELTAAHPSRVLTMLGESEAPDCDIEMYVSALSQKEKLASQKRLCCEEVTLKAQGSFVAELPSAALPLLVSDLPTFLWWRSVVDSSQKVFRNLLHASDRLIVDSVEFAKPIAELLAINEIFQKDYGTPVGISDLNWSRLTSWRGLLADFYDVAEYRTALDNIDNVHISYVAPQADANAIGPQALLMAGWLASRLQWDVLDKPASGAADERTSFEFSSKRGQTITVELHRIKDAAIHPGRLAHVELQSLAHGRSFKVERSADRERVVTEAKLGSDVQGGRVLPVRNRSTAQLLSREMEILCNDQMYQEAVSMAARMVDHLSSDVG
ncbi:MAG: glucose-6-phosphate dehydrogenase assembly protein OpcA [Pyrinomonadaceae bacterium]